MLTDIPTNWNLSSSGSDIADQFFQIIEIIIITHNAFTVINNTGLFISFKAVQECFNTVPSGKFRKSPWLDLFREQSLSTFRWFAFITAFNVFVDSASADLAPFRVLAPGKFLEPIPLASLAGHILRA